MHYKKGFDVLVIVSIIILILSLSVASAFSFSDFFKNIWNKITGKTIGQGNSNLVLYFSFNESEGDVTYDLSGFGNNGTTYGAQWTGGRIENALEFNGFSSSVRINDENNSGYVYSNLDNLQPLSAFAWMYPRKNSNELWGCMKPTIISKSIAWYGASGGCLSPDGNWGTGFWGLDLVNASNGKLKLRSYVGYNTTTANSTSTATIDLNKWSFVGITYDESGDRKIHLYIDGNEAEYEEQVASKGLRCPDAYWPVLIGDKEACTAWFNGTIDEVKIWNKVLTLEEIKKEHEPINETKYGVANETTNNAENDSDTENNSFYNQSDLLINTGIEESFIFNISICKDASCQQKTRTFYIDEDIYLDYNSSVNISGTISILVYPDNTARHIDLPSQIKAEQTGAYNLDVTAFKQGYKTVNEEFQFEVIEKEVGVQHTEINGGGLVKGETEKAEKKPGLGVVYYILIVVVIMALVFVLILVVRLMKRKQEFRQGE